MNYSREEFWDSTHKEIYDMWEIHCKWNKWEIKSDKEDNPADDTNYKKVNIEDIPFL